MKRRLELVDNHPLLDWWHDALILDMRVEVRGYLNDASQLMLNHTCKKTYKEGKDYEKSHLCRVFIQVVFLQTIRNNWTKLFHYVVEHYLPTHYQFKTKNGTTKFLLMPWLHNGSLTTQKVKANAIHLKFMKCVATMVGMSGNLKWITSIKYFQSMFKDRDKGQGMFMNPFRYFHLDDVVRGVVQARHFDLYKTFFKSQAERHLAQYLEFEFNDYCYTVIEAAATYGLVDWIAYAVDKKSLFNAELNSLMRIEELMKELIHTALINHQVDLYKWVISKATCKYPSWIIHISDESGNSVYRIDLSHWGIKLISNIIRAQCRPVDDNNAKKAMFECLFATSNFRDFSLHLDPPPNGGGWDSYNTNLNIFVALLELGNVDFANWALSKGYNLAKVKDDWYYWIRILSTCNAEMIQWFLNSLPQFQFDESPDNILFYLASSFVTPRMTKHMQFLMTFNSPLFNRELMLNAFFTRVADGYYYNKDDGTHMESSLATFDWFYAICPDVFKAFDLKFNIWKVAAVDKNLALLEWLFRHLDDFPLGIKVSYLNPDTGAKSQPATHSTILDTNILKWFKDHNL